VELQCKNASIENLSDFVFIGKTARFDIRHKKIARAYFFVNIIVAGVVFVNVVAVAAVIVAGQLKLVVFLGGSALQWWWLNMA
jgi:phage terminase large subunit-like protein